MNVLKTSLSFSLFMTSAMLASTSSMCLFESCRDKTRAVTDVTEEIQEASPNAEPMNAALAFSTTTH